MVARLISDNHFKRSSVVVAMPVLLKGAYEKEIRLKAVQKC